VFTVRTVPRGYKQESWRNEFLVRQLPFVKNVGMEAKDIVGIRHQATADEDIADWEDFMCAVVTVICEVCRTVRAQSLLVFTFCKCSINPVTNPKPRL
jgi:hypothetical protein